MPTGGHVHGGVNVRLQRGSKFAKLLVHGEFRSRLVYKIDDLINQYM